jgi:folate-dependent phosphoribosylglycinamide formyltransferase PurN
LQHLRRVLPGDTPEAVAERIHAVEHALFPAVVASLMRPLISAKGHWWLLRSNGL